MAEDLKKMYRTVMDDHFPPQMTISFGDQVLVYQKRSWKIPDEKTGELIEKGLRYGENPGQEAALYELVNGNLVLGECEFISPGLGLVSSLSEEDMIQSGKHPGKINLTDVDNALNIMRYLVSRPAVVIVKHNNPCGVAYGPTLAEAYDRANMADRIAAFGGCALFNQAMDKDTAELVSQNYLEVVAAPEFEEGTVDILTKRPNLRIIRVRRMDRLSEYATMRFVDFKSLIDGGIIVQQSPLNRIQSAKDFTLARTEYKGKTYAIEREPTEKELEDMLFGWQVEQGITSNSVIYVKNGVTVGIGTGEQDRVGVAEIAIFKAYTKYADALCFRKHGIPYKNLQLEVEKGKRDKALLEEIDQETQRNKGGLMGACMISDAFFPFRDGVDVAIRQGITAVVQPGGSLRDFEVIEACNEANPKVTMVFTGQRAFKH
ncbi:MAG: IMP cyclohydrolase [Deltaproteobacteria bacterium]|nr:IMP cyclohydrolase [Deltaproteobacteria bacterium]MBW1927763.1 IMP cyclohydrolase [Deltaproteobacteria bacterium]MBW2026568.1 IMP cyclohydrolase [Deltaproteobacteria bacterium]MBW2124878.1 IMP cyclohydrolase [Deltaproteobacteria bacterium]RLB19184.1 MAG: IMP cyclohydrolase [Deltaproteobacteria bacterium]